MRAKLSSHLTYANVMATAAMFIALGGSAWALSRGEVKSKHIATNAVKSKHIKQSQVTTAKLRDNAVTAPKLACKGNSAADEMIRAGSVCIDRYENSIWDAPVGGTRITGTIPCDANGQDCKGKIFARSVAGVPPRTGITWFQAQQALANSQKRLPTSAEWQQAVAGTPDSTTCNVGTGSADNTGANSGCISDWGANDMVGNAVEWVADWDEQADNCANWPEDFGEDFTCFGDNTLSRFPGAVIRGGNFNVNTDAGPFAVGTFLRPSESSNAGFRGAR